MMTVKRIAVAFIILAVLGALMLFVLDNTVFALVVVSTGDLTVKDTTLPVVWNSTLSVQADRLVDNP